MLKAPGASQGPVRLDIQQQDLCLHLSLAAPGNYLLTSTAWGISTVPKFP